jgi:GT2 family glycosyltransferase
VLQPLILYPDGTVDSAGDLFTWSGFFWHQSEAPRDDGVKRIFAAKGACMLVRGDLFSSLEGFNESYFAYFEEADLCWRARMVGSEVMICPKAVATHKGGSTTRRVFAPAEIYHLSFRNRIRTLLANPSVSSMWRISSAHFLGCLATADVFALRGRLAVAWAILRALAWPVLNLGAIKTQRAAAQRMRTSGDAAVFEPPLVFPLSARFSARLLLNTLTRWQKSPGPS